MQQPELQPFDVYGQSQADVLKMMGVVGGKLHGGPTIDLPTLRRMVEARENDRSIEKELTDLMRYETWFRAVHALNVQAGDAPY